MSHFLDVYNASDFREAKNNLLLFRAKDYNRFESLFIKGLIIDYSGNLLDIFCNFGLVEKYENQWRANYLINSYQDCFFVTDSFLLPEINRVFPISQDESIFLASQIKLNHTDQVLDIGTGSGIYAIICAIQKAQRVVGIDINPKAVAYAAFNAKLNGVGHMIEFLNMDIRNSSIDEKFSFVVSNPAIIPAPQNSGFYLHSDGGVKGTDMSLSILKIIKNVLLVGGKLKMLSTSLSINGGELEIVKFIREFFKHEKLCFSITELYAPPLKDFSNLFDHYRHLANFDQFEQLYNNLDKTILHYLYLEAKYDNDFIINYKDNKYTLDLEMYNGSWEGRLKRLFLVYSKMAQLQPIQ